ncbi:MAG: DUF4893 domain-containing protein [Alphaproteobacteria bacterium]|nr:DUF4893 domain-containing protein [Alphaproteobacteria bacterium]
MMRLILAAAVLVLAHSAASAESQPAWRTIISEEDLARLEARDEALKTAWSQVTPAPDIIEHMADAEALLNAPAVPVLSQDIAGDWRCRTTKIGGEFATFVRYGWFKCRVTKRSDGSYFFEKISGSQRVSGVLFMESATRFVPLGGRSVNDEPQVAYDPMEPPETDPSFTLHNEVAYLVRVDAQTMRLEFPLPHYESTFDLMELRR